MIVSRTRCDSVTVVTAPHRLTALADQVERLAPSHRDPHRFHEDKSEIVAELLRLAHEVRRG